MLLEINDTTAVEPLFAGWQETILYSCLQKVMGKIFVTDEKSPRSAYAYAGCFAFLVGEPDRELVRVLPEDYMILTPQDERWAALIEEEYPNARRETRFAIRKDTKFDKELLERYASSLPEGYEYRAIDGELYDRCLENRMTADFVSPFDGKEHFLKYGRGIVVMKDGEIVSGASSYTRYNEGIEIEVETAPQERRKHLALAVCAKLILQCLEEGLYPSWDAHDMNSVHLAEKLGYELDHEYPVYIVTEGRRVGSLFSSTMNTRFLPTGDRKYLRSDCPVRITDEEVEWLRSNNYTTIVDLREPAECEKRPCRLETEEGFTYIHRPVTGGSRIPRTVEEVPEVYIGMLDERMDETVRMIMGAKTNVMYFCSAGKDRTGMVSASILSRLGFDDRTIIEDYLNTKGNLMNFLKGLAEAHPGFDINVCIPNVNYIKSALDTPWMRGGGHPVAER